MIKVFDHWEARKGWVSFDSYEAAKKHVNETFHDYWLMDKDNCETCYMEIYNDGVYEVWCAEMGGWLGYRDEFDTPYLDIYYGPREDFSGVKFTALHPRKDYILI